MLTKQKILWIALALVAAIAVIGCDSIGAGTDGDPTVPPDTTAPTVTAISPANEATNVPLNSNITASFSEAMDPETMIAANFTLTQGTTPVAGTVTYTNARATFTPNANLAAATQYTANVTTGATDPAGNALGAYKTWTFTTGSTIDTTAPRVTANAPANAAKDVAIDVAITATFSEKLDLTTINATNFRLTAGDARISGTVAYDDATLIATFSPAADLAGGVTYIATVTDDVHDIAGNRMVADYAWAFTTIEPASLGTGPAGGPAAVDLGTAGNYAILTKAGVSTIGATMVTGNIGVSPISRTGITGFSETMDSTNTFSTSTYVTGNLYAADYTAPTPATLTTAVSDMETAYTTAAGLTLPDFVNLGAGEIGGLTLSPGLYKWGTGVLMTTDVTIWGSSTARWVFQIAENLIVANGARISLAGGALAENIVWQVGSNATLGTTSHFEGTLLAMTDIAAKTGATVNGRLLSQTAATLEANAITEK